MTEPARAYLQRRLFGLKIDALTKQDAVSCAASAIRTRRRLLIGVVNAAKIVHVRSDLSLRDSLLECDLLLADGQSVVWASHFLGRPLPERVAGIDLFESLLALADDDRRRVYLLGATPDVLRAVQEAISVRWPGVRLVGGRDGYFDAIESPQVAADITSSGADMLFIALPSPQKEIFLATYGTGLAVPVMHGVGGSFDVLGGLTRRAPERWQRWGMEWLYRVLQEPGRLWWRYLTTNSIFIVLLVRERLRGTRSYVQTVPTTVNEVAAHE